MISPNLQGVLWSKSLESWDLEKDKQEIIHRVLSMGSLADIRWLKKTYSPEEITTIFIKHPKNVYSLPGYYFIKDYILSRPDLKLNEQDYVQTLY